MSNPEWRSVGNGHLEGPIPIPDLDPSKLTITLSESLKPIPEPESLIFGGTMSDHMLVASFDPVTGWSAPEIKPYGPFTLDPASSCFQYATNIFEGMKAYVGPDGTPRLFRPDKNMTRLARSAERVALPPFNSDALLELIKKLVVVDKKWIPNLEGHSLYMRPTIIGTRASLGVTASDHALLYVILSPTGPYFRTGPKPISLLATTQNVRAWPGGTGSHKLAGNYTSGFSPQRKAAKQGYDQLLWLLKDESGWKVTEAGAMNVFVVVGRDDGDIDLVTPPLDGTILPGVTRDSILAITNAHTAGKLTLPGIPPTKRIHTHERPFTIADMDRWLEQDKLQEMFAVGTAAVVAPVGRVGFQDEDDSKIRDLLLPSYEGGMGPVSWAVRKMIVDIQEGRFEWEGWSVRCE
ncbi:branched-chain amino acid aminotransferase II [Gymnopus androsaceus JB14]|uniref:Branched-chain-amino-acid aminotransferase n=1 Tax=Gymnopus androsaceus JB14 TaxID=1447944 RepID=A0A6A4HG10_9AGAR|nr:branched-chain amino acid aminotransferase II [Gymnopus androsaceus JB14]